MKCKGTWIQEKNWILVNFDFVFYVAKNLCYLPARKREFLNIDSNVCVEVVKKKAETAFFSGTDKKGIW